jgi:thymidylate synthase (FAD)
MDPHAQQEFREYAKIMAEMVKTVCPLAYEAFMDYSVNAVYFSGPELMILKERLADLEMKVDDLVESGLSKREAAEFLDKLAKIRDI